MKAPTLSPEETRELALLRLRAYGPAADIHPDEVERLQTLERALRPPPPEPPDAADGEPDAAAPRRPVGDDEPAVTAGEGAGAEITAHPDADAPPALSRRWRWVVVSLAAVVVVVVAGWLLAQLAAPRPDATLALVPTQPEFVERARISGVLPSLDVEAESIQQYESYGVFVLWSATSDDGQRCLLVTNGEEAQGFSGGSCTPRGLDPIADVTIWPGMAESLAGGLPSGTVIRFQLSGDRVHVWQRSPDEPL